MSFNMYVPTRFVFGNGRLSELSQYKMPGKKAMIVTTNGTSVFKKSRCCICAIQRSTGKPFKIYSDEWCCVCKGKSV